MTRKIVLSTAALFLTLGCGESGVAVTVVGAGEVRAGSLSCRGSCRFRGEKTLSLTAVADEGWSFVGWSGACSGSEACRAPSGSSVQATFGRLSALEVQLAGSGAGVVMASDSRECSGDCVWLTNEPLTLTARANPGSRFAGFSGDCLGLEPCVLSSGRVTATFERVQTVRVVMVGDGSGAVTVGETTCTSSCTVETGDAPVVLSARSNPGSFPPVLTGDCVATPCSVSAPAVVSVEFRKGRQVVVTSVGNGSGTVGLNGAPLCTAAGSCETVVETDVSLEFSAAALDDYSTFRGLDGAGCAGSPCVVPPGSGTVALSARFDSVVVWHRTLNATGHALEVDDVGITVAVVGSGSITVDGTEYAVAPLAAPTMGMVVQFDWDGGTDWVLPLNSHQNQDANPLPEFADIIRLSDGGVVVSGSCRQGRINGAAPCGGFSTPLTLFIGSDGALNEVQTDPTFGSSSLGMARLFDLHEVGGKLVGFRGVGPFVGNVSGGLGYVGEGDAGFLPVFSMPDMPASNVPILNHCTEVGTGLRCLFFHDSDFTLDNCALGPVAGFDGCALVEFDAELRCQRAFRVLASSLAIAGPSSTGPTQPESLLYGVTPPTDFGGGRGTTSMGTWIAEWESTAISRFGQNFNYIYAGNPTWPVHVERLGTQVVAQTAISIYPGYSAEVFGVHYVASAISFDFLSASDLATPLRRWSFTDSTVIPMQLLSTTPFQLADGKLVVLVSGVNVKFGTKSLANDNQLRTHLVVLQP